MFVTRQSSSPAVVGAVEDGFAPEVLGRLCFQNTINYLDSIPALTRGSQALGTGHSVAIGHGCWYSATKTRCDVDTIHRPLSPLVSAHLGAENRCTSLFRHLFSIHAKYTTTTPCPRGPTKKNFKPTTENLLSDG
jgi:hypothetical protein